MLQNFTKESVVKKLISDLEIEDPFPKLAVRDALYAVADVIVRTTIRKQDQSEPKSELMNKLPQEIKVVVQLFLDTLTNYSRIFTEEIRNQYLNYWQQLYDALGYHKIQYSLLGGETPEENTTEWAALKVMELDSAFSQETRIHAAQLIESDDYNGLLNLLFSRENTRVRIVDEESANEIVTTNYGESLAYGLAGLLIKMVENKLNSDSDNANAF